jgi:DNA-directed RNA polymerase subunit L
MYNAVSTCSYMNTNDPEASAKDWERREKELREKYTTITEEEVKFEKRNFELLDAQRFFKPNSFDFIIKSIGIYDNIELMQKVCIVLQNKLIDLIQEIAENTLLIRNSEVTMEHCYDVILENEDYTIGKLLEYHLYERFYYKEKVLSFCGFKKFHPHNTESIIRIAFTDDVTMDQIKYVLKEVCDESQKQMKDIYHLFESRNG